MCDQADEIVEFHCSLLAGVANEICNMEAKRSGYPVGNVGFVGQPCLQRFLEAFKAL